MARPATKKLYEVTVTKSWRFTGEIAAMVRRDTMDRIAKKIGVPKERIKFKFVNEKRN
jgi:hypothetical protein